MAACSVSLANLTTNLEPRAEHIRCGPSKSPLYRPQSNRKCSQVLLGLRSYEQNIPSSLPILRLSEVRRKDCTSEGPGRYHRISRMQDSEALLPFRIRHEPSRNAGEVLTPCLASMTHAASCRAEASNLARPRSLFPRVAKTFSTFWDNENLPFDTQQCPGAPRSCMRVTSSPIKPTRCVCD